MRREQLVNNAASLLASGVNNTVTTFTVTDASRLPATGDFRLTVEKELVLCTAVSGNDLTVVRAIEGTAAVSHAGGTTVAHVLTKAGIRAYLQDNIPLLDALPPLRLLDTSGNSLALGDFGLIYSGAAPDIKQRGTTLTVSRRMTSGGNRATWLTRPLPSQRPFVVTACVGGMGLSGAASVNLGLGLCNSSTGVGVAILYAPVTCQVAVLQFSAVGTVSAAVWGDTAWSANPHVGYLPRMWFRVCYSGSIALFSVSSDGLTWTTLQDQALSALFGSSLPDKVGFLSQSTSYGSTASLFAWDEGANACEPGLLTWYKCDEATSQGLLYDSGPAGLHMPIDPTVGSTGHQISPASVSDVPCAPFTSSLSWDGSAGCHEDGGNGRAADYGLWGVGGSDRTYCMWFKSTAAGNLLGHGHVNNNQQFVIQLGTTALSVDMGWAAGYTTGTNNWCDGVWHHLSLACSAGTMYFYVDGTHYASTNNSINTVPEHTSFGRRCAGGGDQNYIGKVCDMRVYGRALTQPEAANLYAGLNADGTAIVL